MTARCSLRLRIATAATLAFAGMMMTAEVASAQPINGRGRWCITNPMFGGTLECAYYSLEQCMVSARGVSNQCSLNPWYEEQPVPRQRRRDPWR